MPNKLKQIIAGAKKLKAMKKYDGTKWTDLIKLSAKKIRQKELLKPKKKKKCKIENVDIKQKLVVDFE